MVVYDISLSLEDTKTGRVFITSIWSSHPRIVGSRFKLMGEGGGYSDEFRGQVIECKEVV